MSWSSSRARESPSKFADVTTAGEDLLHLLNVLEMSLPHALQEPNYALLDSLSDEFCRGDVLRIFEASFMPTWR